MIDLNFLFRDWCISRQLWWGHRMPMYCATKGSTSIWLAASSQSQAIRDAETRLGGEPDSILQDPDVLDTWFSSAIYPLSALGWPKQVRNKVSFDLPYQRSFDNLLYNFKMICFI